MRATLLGATAVLSRLAVGLFGATCSTMVLSDAGAGGLLSARSEEGTGPESPWHQDSGWEAALGLTAQYPDEIERLRDIRERLRSSNMRIAVGAVHEATELGEAGLGLSREIAGLLGSTYGSSAAHALCVFERSHGLSDEIEQLIIEIAGAGDALTAVHALEALACLGESDPGKFPTISRFIDSDDHRVRAAALRALVRTDSRRSASFVLRPADDDTSHLVRREAVLSIPIVAPDFRFAWPHLIRRVGDSEVAVRRTAVEVIGRYGAQASPAVDSLIVWMEEEELGAPCAEALGSVGEAARPAIPALVSLLQREIDREEVKWRSNPDPICPHPTPPGIIAVIGALDSAATLPAVQRMLGSDVEAIRNMGAWAVTAGRGPRH